MSNLTIVCIDDNRAVLASLERDLSLFLPHFSLELCESALEAEKVIDALFAEGNTVPLLICDHIMPGKTGIDFLIDVGKDPRFANVKKILLTGQADQKDTIRAINRGEIDYYIEKPWELDDIILPVKILITRFILQEGIDYTPFLPVIDQETLYKLLQNK